MTEMILTAFTQASGVRSFALDRSWQLGLAKVSPRRVQQHREILHCKCNRTVSPNPSAMAGLDTCPACDSMLLSGSNGDCLNPVCPGRILKHDSTMVSAASSRKRPTAQLVKDAEMPPAPEGGKKRGMLWASVFCCVFVFCRV
jgi:hypothetical protein